MTLYAQWKQDVITVSVPSLTGTTSFAFNDTNHSVSVQNYNSTYMTQSGSTTAKNQGTYTVRWSLKDKTKYRWSDGSTGDKSATWKINWVNGTSHYSNDIYNRGWKKGNISFETIWEYAKQPSYAYFQSDQIRVTGSGDTCIRGYSSEIANYYNTHGGRDASAVKIDYWSSGGKPYYYEIPANPSDWDPDTGIFLHIGTFNPTN